MQYFISSFIGYFLGTELSAATQARLSTLPCVKLLTLITHEAVHEST